MIMVVSGSFVHADGAGARGYFQPYASLCKVTQTAFLSEVKTACVRPLLHRGG